MAEPNPFPSAEETINHPAYPGAVWNLEPHKKGLLPCAKDRGGPVNISWEVHGDGPRKIILIMGLAGLATSWQRQTKYFGHDHGTENSVLLIDNRGIGLSDSPLQRYTTSQMARDVLEVVDHLGWTAPRSLHITAISLGGMISQELAVLIPERIASWTLFCTAATMETNKTIISTLRERLTLLVPKSAEQAIRETADRLFTNDWLIAPDEAADVPIPGTTPRCGPPPSGDRYIPFVSNYQRFQAQELTKRLDKRLFSVKGFLMQLVSAGWHDKSPEQLKALGDIIGRERIAVVHGDRDNMIDLRLGKLLMERLQPSVALIVEGMGHAPVMERVEWCRNFMAERMAVGERLNETSET
ncbi:hypothetical protein VD0004_g3328 [Verticillium dahliae]|uniref:AB hydrolase-1 domain-containing protein n=1 Tax=Verticillium dahliae TaxID=27337 RepID=A0A444RR32_VERDA|nr:hypothetical protein VD0004_g3328 [Verticillium dahliae]PNH69678.1 hypothetical protein VD0001_g7098 [Verticillium dahliae]RXG43568.1 hypothetical protein VDGE_01161 [Verticillium dahliae]